LLCEDEEDTMIDTRTVGQELQDQVLDAARKGRERVTSTLKTVTETAQHIRPQFAHLPMPSLTMPTLPTPAQLREKVPGLAAKLPTPAQLREKAPGLAAKLPTPAQLVSGAQELVGHARSVRRIVIEQVRTVAAPLAQQAATRLARVGAPPAQPQTTTRVSRVEVASSVPAKDDTAAAKNGRATTGQQKTKPKAKPTTS
jgi:hypothetical protein